METETEKQNSN